MKLLAFPICIAFCVIMLTIAGCRATEAMMQERNLQTPGQKVIEQVLKEERTSFILYQLAQALNSNDNQTWAKPNSSINVVSLYAKEAEEFKYVKTYDSFAIDLLAWVKQQFGANDQDVERMVRSRPTGMQTMLCTSSGVCYSGDDIGCYCCPF